MDRHQQSLVSIWMPVLNGAHLISRALESALCQTYKNIEIIIFDDASTDAIKDIVEKYQSKDDRIKYIRSENNIGPIKSMARCFELSSGIYVQHLADDDWLSENYVEECVELFLEHPNAATIGGRAICLYEKDGKFYFERESEISDGVYTKDFFGRRGHSTDLTWMLFLSMARKKDALRIGQWMKEYSDNPPSELPEDLKIIQKYDYGSDLLYPVKLLEQYDYSVISNKAAYIKLTLLRTTAERKFMQVRAQFLPMEASKISWIMQSYFFRLKLFDNLFRNEWKSYYAKMRIFFATEMISTIFIEMVRNHFSPGFFRDISLPLMRFFEGYTFHEKLWIIILTIPRLFSRILQATHRKLFKKPVPDLYQRNYFLNKRKEFQSVWN